MPIVRLLIPFVLLLSLRDGFSQPSWRRNFPEPRIGDGPALSTVLATRRSTRAFGRRELTDAELGQLLWAGQGVSDNHRTAPSAGALYPLTIHVADARGIWLYLPADHALERESSTDVRADLAIAAHRQSHVRTAAVVVVVSAKVKITAAKYGTSAVRFATLEAGHAAQNVLLQATALGLAAVPVGAFDDDALRRAIGLKPDDTPLYLIPIGAMP